MVVGLVAFIGWLCVTFILGPRNEWGIGCLLIAGIALLSEGLFYFLSVVQLRREKNRTSDDNKGSGEI